jgi:hypothetical protein
MRLVPDWHTAPARDRSLVLWQLIALAVFMTADLVLWVTL